jgi:propanediol dehydratase small subunit
MPDNEKRSFSGRRLNELKIEDVLGGTLSSQDFRISAETLCQQAQTAMDAGYRQVAENLLRAAELTRLTNEEVLDIYDKLRPGRTTYSEMKAIAERLESEFNAPLTASFIREAAEVYLQRGIVKADAGLAPNQSNRSRS